MSDGDPLQAASDSPVDEVSDEQPRDDGARPTGEVAAPSGGRRKKPPSRISLANIVRSMGLLLVIVFAVVFLQQRGGDPVTTVDPSQTLAGAAQRARYPVLAPRGLPSGWRATSARDTAGAGGVLTIEIGYLTPSNEFAQYVQSDVPSAELDRQRLASSAPRGAAMQIGGRAWTPFPAKKSGETALRSRSSGVTLLVTGNASDAELRTLAGSIRPAQSSSG